MDRGPARPHHRHRHPRPARPLAVPLRGRPRRREARRRAAGVDAPDADRLRPRAADRRGVRAGHGARLRRFRSMVRHPELEWAAASPDAARIGERLLVEFKRTGSRTRFADGIPQDVEAQVAWQLGVTGYPVGAHRGPHRRRADDPRAGRRPGPVRRPRRRRRGLPPAPRGRWAVRPRRRARPARPPGRRRRRDRRRRRRRRGRPGADRHPRPAQGASRTPRASSRRPSRPGWGRPRSSAGSGWRVTWKRTKDSETTDWKAVATGLLTTLPETERAAVVGLHTTVRPGFGRCAWCWTRRHR
jgi:hypothetical protein